MKKWINYQLNNKHKTMPILTFPVITKTGDTVLELISNSNKLARGMKIIADEFNTSASLTCMDLSVEAEAFGAKIKFLNDEIPTVIGNVVNNQQEIDALSIPNVGASRTGICIDAVIEAKKLITDRPIFAGVIGPYSLAGRLMDMTEIMINCYEEPDMVHSLIDKCATFIEQYILAFKAAGVDGIVMAEPAAGLLSPLIADEFSTRYVKKIVERVNCDNFIFIYHNCGNVVPLKDSLIDINADVYHFGNAIDIELMLKEMPEDKLIMGNINPILFKNSAPDVIKETVTNLLSRCSNYNNFVISTGCDVPPDRKSVV